MKPGESPPSTSVALLGDLVDSRSLPDREAAQRDLEASLHAVNRLVGALDPLHPTVGDEFQGIYDSLGKAIEAAYLLRALLPAELDFRAGLGRGQVVVLNSLHGIQDGPAWWSARAAVDAAEKSAASPRSRTTRTSFASDADDDSLVAAVRAALLAVDFIWGSWSAPTREIAAALIRGASQQQVAQQLGVTPSAVSQRVRRDGVGVVMESLSRLRELR
jgi:hypothetical protein